MAEEIEGLEHHTHVSAELGQFFALFGEQRVVDVNFAGIDGFQAIDSAAQRGFAGAGRAEEHQNLAGGNLEIDIAEGVVFAVVLIHIPHADHRGTSWIYCHV